VAVKVQRPAVLETVSIDLYIIRNLGIALRSVPQIATDVVAGAFTRPLLGSTLALCMG
jgi:aarF domain-containing kinase